METDHQTQSAGFIERVLETASVEHVMVAAVLAVGFGAALLVLRKRIEADREAANRNRLKSMPGFSGVMGVEPGDVRATAAWRRSRSRS